MTSPRSGSWCLFVLPTANHHHFFLTLRLARKSLQISHKYFALFISTMTDSHRMSGFKRKNIGNLCRGFEISQVIRGLVTGRTRCREVARLRFASLPLHSYTLIFWVFSVLLPLWFDIMLPTNLSVLLWRLGMLRIVELFSDHQWQLTWMSGGSDKPKKTKRELGTCFFASRLVVSGLEGEIQRKISQKLKSLL